MNKILITGASGFIGANLMKELVSLGYDVRGTIRQNTTNSKNSLKKNYIYINDFSSDINWSHALYEIDTIIHCAGISGEKSKENFLSMSKFRSVNVNGTKKLAEQAAKHGIKRIIFLSSIKVYGEKSDNLNLISYNNKIFTETNYSRSKYEAEEEIKKISKSSNLEYVIIRLPAVYGAGTKGNFLRIMKLLKNSIPIPLGNIQNKRSFISINNLIDFLILCVTNKSAVNQTFLVSDNQDLSTTELIIKIANAMGKKPNLFKIPISLLKLAGYIYGNLKDIDRLTNSLAIDINETCKILDWKPPYRVDDELKKMAIMFMKSHYND